MKKKVGKTLYKGKKHLTKSEAKKAVMMIEQQGLPVSDTMRKLGYSENTAMHMSARFTETPLYQRTKNELKEAILRKDKTYFDTLARVAVEGLDATTVKHFAHEGVVKDEREYMDHQTRHKYLELGARLFGFLKDDAGGDQYIFNPTSFFLMMRKAETERKLAEVEG